MEYIFGVKKNNGAIVENLKTIGVVHSDLKGYVEVVREFPDNIISDRFIVTQKYDSKEDEAGNCYDFYVIKDHNRTEDKFSPKRNTIEDMQADLLSVQAIVVDQQIIIAQLGGN